MINRIFYLSVLFVLFWTNALGQKNTVINLDSLSNRYPDLNNIVEINVQGLELSEFVNGISQSQGLNIGLSPKVQGTIDQTFANVKIKDILHFIIQEHSLEVKIIGDIIYLVPQKVKEESIPDEYGYITVSDTGTINIDINNKSVSDIIRGISKKTNENIILSPAANNKKVSLYLSNVDIATLIDKLAYLSENELKKDSVSGIYYLNKKEIVEVEVPGTEKVSGKDWNKYNASNTLNNREFAFEINGSLLRVKANSTSIQDLLQRVADEMNVNFVFLDDMQSEKVTMQLEGVPFETFLDYSLSGTKFRYVKMDDTYIVGADDHLQIKSTEFFKFENRTYENVLESVPEDLKRDLQINEFAELNGFIINGNLQLINRLTNFLKSIDQRVPMVTIDLIIVDYNTSRSTSTGIDMGFGPQGDNVRSQGTLSPGININLNSNSINKILSGFEKVGLFNLGKVTPDFYFNLKLLESQGVLKTRSTPKITTLNGQEASLSLGRTEYYLEINNNIIGTQNPTVATSQNYRSVNADLTVNIKPVISSDGQVTLQVNVSQSDFTNRINENAPPGTVSRNFESIVRVGNDEMIILGGLEDVTKDRSGSGIPILNRIPFIKYFFSNREDSFQKSKLNIFIKPTIYY